MVQGKTLAFPVLSQVLDSLLPANGENGTSSSFVTKILTLPENTRKDQWEPVMQRYQNELEMWLANYAKDAPVVKMENGLSALDFTYEIPMEDIFEQIGTLYRKFVADPEVIALIKAESSRRTEIVPATATFDVAHYAAYPVEVQVGGATIFVLNVEQFVKA